METGLLKGSAVAKLREQKKISFEIKKQWIYESQNHILKWLRHKTFHIPQKA